MKGDELIDLAAHRAAKELPPTPDLGEEVMTIYEDGSISFPSDDALTGYICEIYDDFIDCLMEAVKEEHEIGEPIGIVSAAVREWLQQMGKVLP